MQGRACSSVASGSISAQPVASQGSAARPVRPGAHSSARNAATSSEPPSTST
jgi:hypothetical protein